MNTKWRRITVVLYYVGIFIAIAGAALDSFTEHANRLGHLIGITGFILTFMAFVASVMSAIRGR